jgi:hypothetical protein
MRLSIRLSVASILLILAVSAFAICTGDKDSIDPSLRNYDGTIGDKYRIRATLAIIGNKIEGVYFYSTHLKDIHIKGMITDGTRITMDELDSKGNTTGRFEGNFPEYDPKGKFGSNKLRCEVIVGSWSSIGKPDIKLPFSLSLTSETGGTLKNLYSAAGAKNDDLIHRNAKRFCDAVKSGDKKTVASCIDYPIKVTLQKGKKTIGNSKELMDNYDLIFLPPYVEAISKAIPRNMFARDQGIMLGNGEVWFNADGKVIALNNF